MPQLVPRALAILEREPLTDAYFYPGDLLASLMEATDWLRARPALLKRIVPVVHAAIERLDEPEDLSGRLVQFLTTVRVGD